MNKRTNNKDTKVTIVHIFFQNPFVSYSKNGLETDFKTSNIIYPVVGNITTLTKKDKNSLFKPCKAYYLNYISQYIL